MSLAHSASDADVPIAIAWCAYDEVLRSTLTGRVT